MANLHPFLNMNTGSSEAQGTSSAAANRHRNIQSLEQLVLDICNPDLRDNSLLELSKRKEWFLDLAPLIWFSSGTMAVLLQEVVSIYPVLSPPKLTLGQSMRVCNVLIMLKFVASHPETRILFLNACIHMYMYPFLNTTSRSKPFEFLRLTSLGVIGALVKSYDTEVIRFLLPTEIVPLCLRSMDIGDELSKTVATFILQNILLNDAGLDYVCLAAERFFAVVRVLNNMVAALAQQPSPCSRLLKHIIRCYLRLSYNLRACEALRALLSQRLMDGTFDSCFREDRRMRMWLRQLLHNLQIPV